MKQPPVVPIVAYSYIRFSTPEQAEGDSLRRQVERAEAYCQRHGWTLDTKLSPRDLGMSAFKGKNAMVGNLRTFLDAVARGTVAPGSALIVESVDRISRQGIDEGYDLCKSILKAGVHIVTLSPERDFGPEAVKSLSKGALELQLILERAAEESERKSERNGDAWREKVKQARNGATLGNVLPAWVEWTGGTMERTRYGGFRRVGGERVLIPERAEIVKEIFRMAGSGYGMASIVKKLTDDKVPAWGRGWKSKERVWVRAYVAKILKDKRALGEHQPCGPGRKPVGKPIKGYFPAAVTEAEFYAARAGAAERKKKRGRIGDHVNVFAGLIKNARDGDAFFSTKLAASKGGTRILVNNAGAEGRKPYESFPLDVFETEVFKWLTEINPHDILNGDHGPDETTALAAEFATIEGRIAELQAELRKGDVAAIGAVLRQLEEEQRQVAARLADARQKAAHPLSETWGEAQTLAQTLLTAPDPVDARLRLRSMLRRMVDSIHLLVVTSGKLRICAAQIWFAGGKRQRSYVIVYRPAQGNGKTRQEAAFGSKSMADVARPEDIDLRRRADVKRLEKPLAEMRLEK